MAGIFALTHEQEERLNLEAARMRLRKDEDAARARQQSDAAEIASLRAQLAAQAQASAGGTVVQPQ